MPIKYNLTRKTWKFKRRLKTMLKMTVIERKSKNYIYKIDNIRKTR